MCRVRVCVPCRVGVCVVGCYSGGCVTDVEGVGVWVWALEIVLGAEGAAAALAGLLGNLVHLTSLNLRGT